MTSTKSTRGGMILDSLYIGDYAASGIDRLLELRTRLDAKTAREIAAALEHFDQSGATWTEILEQEHNWARRTIGPIAYRWNQLTMLWSSNKEFQKWEQRFNDGQRKVRRAMVDFAARAYELEKGGSPKGWPDLVPAYLKAIPLDPVTGTNLVFSP